MGILYAIITASILFCQGLSFKIYALKGGKVQASSELINLVNFAICVAILVPIALLSASFDSLSVMYGLVQGVMFWLLITFYGKAVSTGKIAFCNFIMAMTMIFPIIFSAVYSNFSSAIDEPLTIISVLGLVVFGVAAYLMCFGEKSNDGKKVSRISYVFIFVSGFFSGLQSIWIKYTAISYPSVNQYYVLATAFSVSLVLALLVQLYKFVARKKCNAQQIAPLTDNLDDNTVTESKEKFDVKKFIICGIVVGLATAIGNICFNVFSIKSNSATFFPIANGLPMLLAVALSPLFHEKVTKMQLLGVLSALVAIVLLNI